MQPQKRLLFILLIVSAAVALGLVFWYILRPVLPSLPGTTQQPAPLPAGVPFDPSKSAPQPPTNEVKVDPNSAAEKQRQSDEALKRQAMDFAARQGTYSNADDYQALRDAQANVTDALKAKLEARRVQLKKDHPTFGTPYSQTIRTLSSEISGTGVVKVQAQQITEEQGKARVVATVIVTVTMQKSGDNWIPSDVTLEPYNP